MRNPCGPGCILGCNDPGDCIVLACHSYDDACCPDPDPADMADQFDEDERDIYAFDVIHRAGFDPDTTPVDTLMAANMGYGVAAAMG